MRILVFLQGTTIVHEQAAGKPRAAIIEQVRSDHPSVRDYSAYLPIGNAAEKLRHWETQGATISYLSALTESKKGRQDEQVLGAIGLRADATVLSRHRFPTGTIYHRSPGESYAQTIARMQPLPDVMIEDDCESIGGQSEIAYHMLPGHLPARIRSIVVPEFGGIDHLPNDLDVLRSTS